MTSKQNEIEKRVIEEAWCLYENELTVREVAKQFNISKTTVHKDLTERLPDIMGLLAIAVDNILQKNKSERHIRGGYATKLKYSLEKGE